MNQTTVVKIFLIVMVVLYIVGTSYGLIREKKQPDEAEIKRLEDMTCEELKEELKERLGKGKWLNCLADRIDSVECK